MRLPRADIFFAFRKRSQRKGLVGAPWRWLERIGPVTRSSPTRRAVQTICLILFMDSFFRVCWPYSEKFTATTFSDKEWLPVDLFLLLDPLVGLTTAIAGRVLNPPTLCWLFGVLAFCIVIPRAFCGYFCPLGTLIDVFDWLIGRRFKRWHVADNPTGLATPRHWVHFKHYLLVAVLVSSLFGVLTSGYVSAIPVLTRGMLFSLGRVQLGWMKGENQLGPIGPTFFVSLFLFAAVFLLSLRGRRFWCRYVCPSGALLSALNFFRVGERKVESSCINCNQCVEICPFDAIQEDFNTRQSECTYCQTCGGVCPSHSIKFVTRWNLIDLKANDDRQVEPRPLSRRGFVAAGAFGVAAAVATEATSAIGRNKTEARPMRPPGSVPEREFLDLCIRCGECFKVCPGPVLHPAGLEYGLESLWTPVAHPHHAGCHQECTSCTQVCPTGAIQPLNLSVKQQTHMGLAIINEKTCLPFDEANREECNVCYVECEQAGYQAIEMRRIELPIDREELEGQGFTDFEIDEMGSIRAPFVDAEKCTGCGICTYRCHTRYSKQDDRLNESAVTISARNEHRRLDFPTTPDALGSPDT